MENKEPFSGRLEELSPEELVEESHRLVDYPYKQPTMENNLLLTKIRKVLELAEFDGRRIILDNEDDIVAQLSKVLKAGYVKLPESMELTELATVLYNLMKDGGVDYNNIKRTIQSFLLANHYVKLANDQISPINPLSASTILKDDTDRWLGYNQAQQDMLKVVDGKAFRKVKVKE